MIKLSHYWKRFVSGTPKALAVLRNISLGVAAAATAGLVIIAQYPELIEFKPICIKGLFIASAFAAGLQMSTNSPNLGETKITEDKQ